MLKTFAKNIKQKRSSILAKLKTSKTTFRQNVYKYTKKETITNIFISQRISIKKHEVQKIGVYKTMTIYENYTKNTQKQGDNTTSYKIMFTNKI